MAEKPQLFRDSILAEAREMPNPPEASSVSFLRKAVQDDHLPIDACGCPGSELKLLEQRLSCLWLELKRRRFIRLTPKNREWQNSDTVLLSIGPKLSGARSTESSSGAGLTMSRSTTSLPEQAVQPVPGHQADPSRPVT